MSFETTTTDPASDPSTGGDDNIETSKVFIPTPERLSQYLEMNIEEVRAELTSVEGRKSLYGRIVEHEDDLKEIYPDFNPDGLQEQLELIGDVLHQKEEYMKDVTSPEKKGLFRRAWDNVKSFAKNHPVITTLLVIALIAAGGAVAWKLMSAAEVAQTGAGAEVINEFIEGTDAVNRGIGPMNGFNPHNGMPPGS